MNSKLLKIFLLSSGIVLLFVLMVFNMRANGIKSQRFHFIRVEWWHDMRSTTSNPPFVWSYTTLTCGFDLLLIVTLTGWCMVVRQMMFFFPYFFLSMHESIMKILLWWAKMVYFYSLSFSDFITLGMPLQSYCMVPTKVNFWSMPYSAIETEVKYLSIKILQTSIESWNFWGKVLVCSSLPVTHY